MAGKKGAIKMNQDYQEELLHLESCLSLIRKTSGCTKPVNRLREKRLQHYFRLSVRGREILTAS